MKSNNIYEVKIDKETLIKALNRGDRSMKMSSRMSMIVYFMENNGIKHGKDIFLDVENDEIYFENYVFGLGDDDCEFNFTSDYISIVDTDGYDLTIAKNGEIAVFEPDECFCSELEECLRVADDEIKMLREKIAKQDKLIKQQDIKRYQILHERLRDYKKVYAIASDRCIYRYFLIESGTTRKEITLIENKSDFECIGGNDDVLIILLGYWHMNTWIDLEKLKKFDTLPISKV